MNYSVATVRSQYDVWYCAHPVIFNTILHSVFKKEIWGHGRKHLHFLTEIVKQKGLYTFQRALAVLGMSPEGEYFLCLQI